jgi:hypothetical protein
LLREIVELSSGGGKRFLNGHFNVLVPVVIWWRVIDYDILV